MSANRSLQDADEPRRPTKPVGSLCGLSDNTVVRNVRLSDIDLSDRRFQYRLTTTVHALERSLATDGQQTPVLLWGAQAPFVIVDGFRRATAALELGWENVKAIVRDNLDEESAFALSFIENVNRKNFSPLDKANAIWRAIHERGLSKDDVAGAFGMSERQLNRYLELLDLDEAVRAAVVSGDISMAHAVMLCRLAVEDPSDLIRRIKCERISVRDLRKRLKLPRRVGRPRDYIVLEGTGFRCRAFRYHPPIEAEEKERIRKALERGLAILRRTG